MVGCRVKVGRKIRAKTAKRAKRAKREEEQGLLGVRSG
jgi:hypothetical protein